MDHRANLDRYSSNLPGEPTRADGGEIAFRRALITVEVFQCTQCAGCPLGHPRIPSHKGRCSHFFFCLLIVLFSPFTISHDRTHLGADFVFALCHFARSDTPWPQGSRTYSAQKNLTCPGHIDRPILLHFPLISLRDSRQEHSGPGSWRNTSELISLRDSRR